MDPRFEPRTPQVPRLRMQTSDRRSGCSRIVLMSSWGDCAGERGGVCGRETFKLRVVFDCHVCTRSSHFEGTRPGNFFFGESYRWPSVESDVFESSGE